ncbi:MAG: histone-lysine N-methyltransferase [Eggerthellaceae bacterium]|nr:histone-lysine N-methyltransferase [Eggerthellaceae bacterium]
MSKRRTHDSDDRYLDSGDNPIGLTGAFTPVKGPQSVDYAAEDDPVGLTQAFGAINPEEEERDWGEEDKWKGFDWNAGYDSQESEAADAADDAAEPAPAEAEPAPEAEVPEAAAEMPVAPAAAAPAPAPSGRGRHAAPDAELSPRMQKSRRTRKVLIILIVLLIVLGGLVAFFGYKTFTGTQQDTAQQAHQKQEEATTNSQNSIQDMEGNDAVQTAVAQTQVPNLTALFGKTAEEAVAAIGHGALVTSNRAVDDSSSAVKTNLSVALTEEPADSKTGTPTVYLGLDKDGKVIQVGYSASAGALGFGTLSFADAISGEHVIEKTLAKIGIQVPEGSAVLPTDKASYSTYASDNTTVVKERCSFEGPIDVNGVACTWSAVLSYDYTTQIVTGNLNDTVRIIYVYISENVEPEPAPEETPPAE